MNPEIMLGLSLAFIFCGVWIGSARHLWPGFPDRELALATGFGVGMLSCGIVSLVAYAVVRWMMR